MTKKAPYYHYYQVKAILLDHFTRSFPVDVLSLIKTLNIDVKREGNHPENAIGSITLVDDYPTIRLYGEHSIMRQQFIVTHLMSFWVNGHLKKGETIVKHDNHFTMDASPADQEANYFVMDVLAPKAALDYAIFTLQMKVENLATSFGVSQVLMAQQLKRYCFIK